jgi:hypothetical protein
MEAMFFEHGCRDERQLVNGLAEFRGHASHSNGYEANSSDGVRNLQQAIEPTGFLSAGSVHLLRRPVRRASGSGSRGPEFDSSPTRFSKSTHSQLCADCRDGWLWGLANANANPAKLSSRDGFSANS